MIRTRVRPCKPRWLGSSIRFCHRVGYNEIWCRCSWWNWIVCSRKSDSCLKNCVGLCWDWRRSHFANVHCHWYIFLDSCVRCKVVEDIHCSCRCTRVVRTYKCYHRNTSSSWNCRNVRLIPPAFLCLSWCCAADRWGWACTKTFIYRIVDPRLCHNNLCSSHIISNWADPVGGCSRSISCVWATVI